MILEGNCIAADCSIVALHSEVRGVEFYIFVFFVLSGLT